MSNETEPRAGRTLESFLRHFALTAVVFLGGSCAGTVGASQVAEGSVLAQIAGFFAIPVGMMAAISVTQFFGVIFGLLSGARDALKQRSLSALLFAEVPQWIYFLIPVVTTIVATVCGAVVGAASETHGVLAVAGVFGVAGLVAGSVFCFQARAGWFDHMA